MRGVKKVTQVSDDVTYFGAAVSISSITTPVVGGASVPKLILDKPPSTVPPTSTTTRERTPIVTRQDGRSIE